MCMWENLLTTVGCMKYTLNIGLVEFSHIEELILYGIESCSVIIGNFMPYLFITFVCQSLPLKLNNFTVEL